MNLLNALSKRGDVPSAAGPQFPQAGMLGGRGTMPWSSGFEGQQAAAMQELMRLLQQRAQLQQGMSMRHMQIPQVSAPGR